MADNDAPLSKPLNEKLRFMKSPIKEDDATLDALSTGLQTLNPAAVKHLGYRSELKDEPVLLRNNDATNLEVFYDLFLAVATLQGLAAYVGFFSLMWTTWFQTGCFDVRFITDSIFERCARAVHLGVLVGFAVVSPNFDPSEQDPQVFKTFSFILMVSRLCLALEYGSIIFHVRRYTKAKMPLIIMVVSNILAAIIYFGVAFRFDKHESRIFYVWYGISVLEVVSNVGFSVYYSVLSFQGTHLIRRMSLLTLIIFGEGVAIACGAVSSVVESGHDAWTSKTIGVVTAAVSTIYLVFMVYFDWMRHLHLPQWRQLSWTLLHFPLHLCMTLFMEGAAQFIIFWKIAEIETDVLLAGFNNIINTSAFVDVVDNLWEFTHNFTTKYPVTYTYSDDAILAAFTDMGEIDLQAVSDRLVNATAEEVAADPGILALDHAIQSVLYTLDNVIFHIFDIDFTEDATEDYTEIDWENDDHRAFDENLMERSFKRFRTVFQYTFVCAGAFLALSNALYCLAHTEKWHRWAIARATVNFLIAAGIGLVACVSQNNQYLVNYQNTPYILPTLLFAYIFVLVMNHLPHAPPVFGAPRFSWWKRFSGAARRRSSDVEATQQTELMQTKYDPGEHHMGGSPDFVVSQGHEYQMPQQPRSVSAAQGRYQAVGQEYAYEGQYQSPPPQQQQQQPPQQQQTEYWEYSGESGYRQG
ncbi:hypothetical protein ACHAQA_005639 [Verticillium albo-atrum]